MMTIAEQLIRAKTDYDEVFEDGKQAEYDAFWDNFQQNGNRTAYSSAFGSGWNAEIFKPKYIIRPSGQHGGFLFHFFNYGSPIMDFRMVKDKIDISGTTNATSMFENAWVDYIEVDFTHITNASNCFSEGYSPGHKTHITLKVSTKTTSGLTNAFYYCNTLTHLFFESGSEIVGSINTQHSPLVKESIESVVAALSSTATGQTCTFNKAAKEAAFTAEEWAYLIASKTNWTFSLI